jgi:hypothetical protein
MNFMLTPTAIHFLGFTLASVAFDVLAFCTGYNRLFEKKVLGGISLFSISVFCAAVAGSIIAVFFMAPIALQKWGGVLGWVALHAVGGVIGGALGVFLMNALTARGIHATSRKSEKANIAERMEEIENRNFPESYIKIFKSVVFAYATSNAFLRRNHSSLHLCSSLRSSQENAI